MRRYLEDLILGRYPRRDNVQVQGIADLVALDQAASHRERLLEVAGSLDGTRNRLARIEAISGAVAVLLASLAGLSILALAILLMTSGQLEGVFLAALPLAAIATFEAVHPLSRAVQLYDSTRASADRLFSLIDEPAPVMDPRKPLALPDEFGIEIREVSFRYAEDEPWVLDRASLSIAPGESVALVGPSGSGKTTIVDLLLRFWDFDSGSIQIGERELRTMAAAEVRTMLGVVPQDIHLFDTTIRENLALADADVTEERMAEACHSAQLHDWIKTLPLGYETVVGEGGVLLSGGERRRLAIARVLIKRPPIVIFDEATADLDARTEARLWASLAPFLEGRTALLISHRPMIGLHADRTVSLESQLSVPNALGKSPGSLGSPYS
jgi:ATP-binding cassette subfamily C protein CydC